MNRSVPRRVVTGHTPNGRSVVVSDGPVPVTKVVAKAGVALHEVWSTNSTPAVITAQVDVDPAGGELTLPPPPLGTKVRIAEFQPGHLDQAGLQAPVHRTSSIDYGIVLEGQLVLVLDDSEVVLGPGDVVVQCGTDHAWANRSEELARIAFVMVDADFDPALLSILSGALRQAEIHQSADVLTEP